MGIDLKKLKSVREKFTKTTAQCPACEASGHDSKGDHLVIFPSGKFSCVAHPGDSEHRKLILSLVGASKRSEPVLRTFTVNPFNPPESIVIKELRESDRFAGDLKRSWEQESDAEECGAGTQVITATAVKHPTPAPTDYRQREGEKFSAYRLRMYMGGNQSQRPTQTTAPWRDTNANSAAPDLN
jgi:hypothetical protein